LILFWFLVGCSGLPTPRLSALATATPRPTITLQPCTLSGQRAECGSLTVLEDREARSGRRINLNVVVFRARSDQPAPDPIFYLAGGPGVAATDDAAGALQLLESANERRDLVFVDQRGTGGSNKLTCPMPADPARQVEDLRACLANLAGDPRAYTTAWAMDDLDDVRAALGYDQINLVGASYGATAAQVYLLRHGEHVRTATLMAGSLLDVPMFERYPLSSQAALDLLFARCAADLACHAAYPNLRQEFAEILAQLDQQPMTMTIVDPQTGQPGQFTRDMLDVGLHQLLVGTETTALVPEAIHLLYAKRWDAVQALLASRSSSANPAPQWTVMNLTILCSEDWAKLRPAETTAVSGGSYLRYNDIRALTVPENLCGVMPRPKAAALYGPVAGSNVPVLLINGQADPQDPPANVAGAKQHYPNSLTLVAPGQAHVSTGVFCRFTIFIAFVERASLANLPTACLDQVVLPPFAG
jgi:pimeloyl-ACP methyl ester carboxylesterase